jgi:hypothetical protein
MHKLGAVTSYRDSKKQFYEQYHLPFLEAKALQTTTKTVAKPAAVNV